MARSLVLVPLAALLAVLLLSKVAEASSDSLLQRLPPDEDDIESAGDSDLPSNGFDQDMTDDNLSPVEMDTADSDVVPNLERQDEEPHGEDVEETTPVQKLSSEVSHMKFQQMLNEIGNEDQSGGSAKATVAKAKKENKKKKEKKKADTTDSPQTVEQIILDAQKGTDKIKVKADGQDSTNMDAGNQKDKFSIWHKQSLVEQQKVMQETLVQIRKLEAKAVEHIAAIRLRWEAKQSRAQAQLKKEAERRQLNS